VQRVDLPGADHTFSVAGAGPQVAQITLNWLRQLDTATTVPAQR
jgi:hypothetical protein